MKIPRILSRPPFTWLLKWGSIRCVCAIICFLTACAPKHNHEVNDIRESRLRMFEHTFNKVDRIYLKKIKLHKLAMAGLKSLSQIEPKFFAAKKNGDIEISVSGVEAYRSKLPQSAKEWAHYFVNGLEKISALSHRIAKTSDEVIFEVIFSGLIGQLDKNSHYASAQSAAANRVNRQGYGGIGVTLETHSEGARIVKVVENLPAALSNLRTGDVIKIVSGTNISGFPINKIQELIRGPINVPVSVQIRRGLRSPPKRYLLERARITADTVSVSYKQGISFFRISSFNQETSKQLERLIKQTKQVRVKNLKGIVLDLRGNPGGLFNQAIKIADLFLNDGDIVSTRGRHVRSVKTFKAKHGDILKGLPMAVLVDGATASSAEIIASALQDNGRAVIIGSSSFGKGTVQTIITLPNNGELTLTWALLVAPSNYTLERFGVIPSICTSYKNVVHRNFDEIASYSSSLYQQNLHLRRTLSKPLSINKLKVKKMCEWRSKEKNSHDDLIAVKVLRSKSRYSEVIALMKFKSEHQ